MTDDDNPDRRARDLGADEVGLDALSIEKWFELPSFQQLAEAQAADPRRADARGEPTAKDRALAAVDPRLVEALFTRPHRIEGALQVATAWRTRVHDHLPMSTPWEAPVDDGLFRTYDIPVQLAEDLSSSVPQALLRDLFRMESEFAKEFYYQEVDLGDRDALRAAHADARAELQRAKPTVSGNAMLDAWRALRDDHAAAWRDSIAAAPPAPTPSAPAPRQEPS